MCRLEDEVWGSSAVLGENPGFGFGLGLVANTGGVIMLTFDVFWSVLLPAPSPALPEAMAGAPSMEGYLATARATQLVDIVR